MSVSFVHLHIHSDYSLVDSVIRLPDKPEYGDPAKAPRPNLISRAVELKTPALALTDQNNLFALVKFYRAAEANGIKPIAGADLWIANSAEPTKPTRLTLLCQNRTGYLNLARLISRSFIEGRHGDFAIVDPTWFAGNSDGLIALAGRASDVGHLVLADKHDAALARTREWLRHFDDRWYFEITRVGHADETHFLENILQVAAASGTPVVATNDVRFLTRDDFEAHEARVCIHSGRSLSDPKRPRDYTPEQYLKSAEEMAELFADLPEALRNSVEIAKRCNLELTFGKYFLPVFPVPPQETVETFIRASAHTGLAARLAKHAPAQNFTVADYEQRLDTELDVIITMGFPGYFLIVADFINWAKSHDIPVGPGRGSGAGSLVAYSLGITDLDPLAYGLLFERFLNPERVSMPDFDVDFCMDRRDEVIDYVARKYGRDKVSQIITYGTMAAKAVVRDTGRVLGMSYGHVDKIAKLIPLRPADPLTLEDALGISERSRKESDRIVADFKAMYESDDDVRDLVDLALKLEDLIRNAGKHAGGVVIAPSALTDFAPLYSEGGSDGVVTQFDKDDVESVGLVKFDFLGLRTLTIIDWTVKAINARRAKTGEAPLDIAQLPLDDPTVYTLFKRAQTVAVFQFESRGMQAMLKDAKPDRFEDIIALGALFRPGPMDLIPSYCKRKHGEEPIDYPDPRVESILAETYGIMVYQEQVMQMAQIVGGYSLGGADLLRRAMGKKNPAEMSKQRVVFREGAAQNGVDERKADAVFDTMEKFAGYGFNKSHAAAYALVSYQTAWLKTHYPAEFMAAVLSSDMDNTDKVVNFLAEAKAIGVTVMPPDVNGSGYMFEALDAREGKKQSTIVRYGLGAVKGVGQGAVENIVEARKRGVFTELADFCRRIDMQKANKRALEALILSGAMDSLAANRASVMAQLPECTRAAEQHARDALAGQHDMFGAASSAPAPTHKLVTVEDWSPEQKLAGERETLGHYLSGHPTDTWRAVMTQLATCSIGEIAQKFQPPKPRKSDDGENRFRRPMETPWIAAGQLVDLRKRGDTMAFAQLEDWGGRIELSFFRDTFLEFGAMLTRDAFLVAEGGLAYDEFAGGLRIRVKRLMTLNEAIERHARAFHLTLNGVDANFSASLQKVLAGYRGGRTPLRLSYGNSIATADIDLGNEWRVRATSDLKRELEKLPGVKSAELILNKPSLNAESDRAA
ncbi:MAG TPA: DNA polymerase III subunit alpha [Rudaea sp.]|jgi:DNA polymerase-3 subunit alpha|nr:DNA polymerase III subunit alpha [Rudaea sp.]